jgi:NAD(P)-dependent dehydrogenase (short-subunit alcohol dehydrogenase family)
VAHVLELFDLSGRVAAITGGAGLLGEQHAQAVAAAGGTPVIVDVRRAEAEDVAARLGGEASAIEADVTDEGQVERVRDELIGRYGRIDILVNNAARDPKVDATGLAGSRPEVMPLGEWEADLAVGLTAAFLCSRVLGAEMAKRRKGAIVNVASDLALISPDQRLYRRPRLRADQQPVKPASYVVAKTALLGLTRYFATYWATAGVRVNALSPGGVRTDQPDQFVQRLSALIPLGRMARREEYRGALLFLCSDASAYVTGQNLVVDGGRTAC